MKRFARKLLIDPGTPNRHTVPEAKRIYPPQEMHRKYSVCSIWAVRISVLFKEREDLRLRVSFQSTINTGLATVCFVLR